jgi:hypothetical protein
MTAPEGHLDVLDPRFPIRLVQRAVIHDRLLEERPDRACARGVEARARTHDSQQQERFIAPQPRWVPGETSVDGLPPVLEHDDAWYGDRFPREGMPQPGDTDTFLAAYDRAGADEQEAAERRAVRRVRRAVGRLVRGT